MLIVSRKIGESIAIGEGITVTISDIKGGYVRLAVVAPRDRYPVSRIDGQLGAQLLGDAIGQHYRKTQEERAKAAAKKAKSR